MKTSRSKSLLAAIALGITTSISGVGYAATNEASVSVQVSVQQNVKGTVNWEKGTAADVEAIGLGLPPANMPGARGTILARRAAVVDAYRQLAEVIAGVQLDADTTMRDLTIESDIVRTKVQALIKGAHIIEERANKDGSYSVKIGLPLYGAGSVAAVAVPEIKTQEYVTPEVKTTEPALSEAEENVASEAKVSEPTVPPVVASVPTINNSTKAQAQGQSYTGVIVDASGLGLEGTFSPLIYDASGRTIYGMRNVDKEYAISHGMVEYSNDLQASISNSRAGAKPLVVKAISVKGGENSVNHVNVVVSAEDADKILAANEQTSILENRAVVFVK